MGSDRILRNSWGNSWVLQERIWEWGGLGRFPRVCKRWFPNGGSSFVGERNSATPFFTSILPQFCLCFTSIGTSFLPHFNPCFQPLLSRQSRTTVWKPRFTDPWDLGSQEASVQIRASGSIQLKDLASSCCVCVTVCLSTRRMSMCRQAASQLHLSASETLRLRKPCFKHPRMRCCGGPLCPMCPEEAREEKTLDTRRGLRTHRTSK